MASTRPNRGFTLLELLIVVAVMGFVITGITRAMIDMGDANRVRRSVAQLQGEGRDALRSMERDIRGASLGSSVGVIWTQDDLGNVVQRPAVQIFDNVVGEPGEPGDNTLVDIKPGTDALLLVGGRSEPIGIVIGTQYDSTKANPIPVTETKGFSVGQPVLIGQSNLAAWDVILGPDPADQGGPGKLELSSTQNVFPKGKMEGGSSVRVGWSRLYYVNTNDELVRMVLSVPRAPTTEEQILGRETLSTGIENMQVDCELDDGTAFIACAAPLDATDPIALESETAFGVGSGGPRFTTGNVATVRVVDVEIVARSRNPMQTSRGGDPKVAIGNQDVLPVGGAPDGEPYTRRAYRLTNAIRNTSLEAL